MPQMPEPKHLPEFTKKMKDERLPRLVIDMFSHYYRQVVAGSTGLVSDREIDPLDGGEIADARELSRFAAAGGRALEKTVMIVLNGGLGTSMGLTGPKSLLRAKEGKSFLQLIIEQSEASGVDLIFMNSFNTDAQTREAVRAIGPARPVRYFLQHKFPKIFRENLAPADWPADRDLEWNPPGHGEVYTALQTSGLLRRLLSDGMEYALIVNCDNLGATLDRGLLGYFAENNFGIMMEAARRTPADMKGGHLARNRNGRLLLREIAQCPPDELQAFQDIEHYRFFNTNSIWVNLRALQELTDRSHFLHMPLILNPKTLDPRDKSSPPVYQIETAMGSAIALFDNATAVHVPLERFSPVKKCADLLALRSDCFILGTDGGVAPNPRRRLGRIKIKLDDDYYGRIDDFEKRFAQGPPSLVGCAALTVEGDVRFEAGVAIRGSVRIRNTRPEQAVVRAGALVEQDVTF